MKKKNKQTKQEETLSPAPPTFRVPFSFASCPLSESLGQATGFPAKRRHFAGKPVACVAGGIGYCSRVRFGGGAVVYRDLTAEPSRAAIYF